MNIQDWFSFRIYWFHLLAVQGNIKSLLQSHSSKAAIHLHSAFFIVQISHPYMTTGKTIAAAAAAAAAVKSLQLCLTLCDPIDSIPPGSPVPGILQARTLEWVAISLSNAWKWKVKVMSFSCVHLLATPWTTAYQAPPSMGFSRQEYWSGVPLPSLIALTKQTFVGKVMSLLFNMLSTLVITFLPRSKHLLISWLRSPSAVILEPLQN